MAIKSINPYNQQVLKEFDALSVANIHEKLSTAQTRFTAWQKTSFEERARLMEKAADVMESKKAHYASLMTQEMGKLSSEALAEVEKCAWCCRYYATHAADFLKDELIETDASKSYLHYEPLGVILAIMPWNFPFWQVIRFAAPTLMAGNVGVLKHASNVPQCALALEEIFIEAGFPEGVFQTLLMNTSDVEEVIKHPAVKAVTLTGSEGAGASVAALAGKYLKKTVLELGGSDPFIILEDVDVAHVAKMAVKGRMINAGQSCIAAKRFIVVKSVAEAFIEAFKEEMGKLQLGDPTQEATTLACMARKDLTDELLEQVQQSIDLGATTILGGKKAKEGEAFFEPTILTNLQQGMPAYDQELFGPVASVIVVEDAEEAIAVANASPYGLGGSIWSKNIEKAEALAHRVASGAVFINGIVKSDPRLPFGGVKLSGYGRELSYLGIREFVNIQTIWVG